MLLFDAGLLRRPGPSMTWAVLCLGFVFILAGLKVGKGVLATVREA